VTIKAGEGRRQSPPAIVWFLAGIVVALAVACAIMAALAWDEAQTVEELQSEMEGLRSERADTQAQLVALQATATAMEERITTLEASDPEEQLAALQAAVEAATGPDDLDSLRALYGQIQSQVDSFEATLDELAERIEDLEPAGVAGEQEIPAEARLVVARQRQGHNLSCESAAASMVAQFYGFDISEADVLAALPRNENPYLGFRGNVDGPTGGIEDYGVYAGPVMAYLNSRGLQAWPVEGGVAGIKAAIARGHPVIAWITYNCLPGTPVETEVSGQVVTLVPNQHTVVVTGYNAQGVWANDPWDGQEDFYSYADFERAMSYFGDMAIEVASP